MAKKSARATQNDHAVETAEPPAEPAEPDAAPDAPAAPEFGDLDKVRSILFGQQSQELEKRIGRLEAHVEQEFGQLRQAIDERFQGLENLLKQQHDALTEQLKQERQERTEAGRVFEQQLGKLGQTVEDHRTEAEARLTDTEQALRSHIDDLSGASARDTAQRFDELSAHLDAALAELRGAKTDRHGLAELFDELAGRLRQD